MNIIIDDVKDIVKNIGGNSYIVGGYIRDKLIKNKDDFKDLDIIYEGDISIFIEKLKYKGYNIIPLKKEKNIYRAIREDKNLDITSLKGINIEEDLKNRDFTINAIAFKLIENKIIDPFKGRKHIENRIIHEVSENSIKEDCIRILRAYRFCIKYGMHFSKSCEEHIIEYSSNIKKYPKERIFNEFMKIIEVDHRGNAFEELDKQGVLKNILPYIDELKIVGKCKYHIEDTFTHMKLVYRNAKDLIENRMFIDGVNLNIFNDKIGEFTVGDYFTFAAFCHDIGKPKCYRKTNDKISFIGHDKEGSKIIENVCMELGFPKQATKFIKILVEAHMYPLGLCKNNVNSYKKSFYEFFSRYDKYIPYILVLCYCDMYATKMLYDPENEQEIFNQYIKKLFEEFKIFRNAVDGKLISGYEVIEFTGAEGKKIKEIIDEVHRKIYYGEINNKQQVIRYLKRKGNL